MEAVTRISEGQVVAIDGKTVRRSHNKSAGQKAIHIVSAWATRNRVALGQVKVDDKSNEITAVPELLRMLQLKGCIVTADALNTQKEIAAEIREQGAEYVLALKENHPILHNEVEGIFESVRKHAATDPTISVFETSEKGHGREETRRCYSIEADAFVTGFEQWRDLKSIIMIESTRVIKEQKTREFRY
jgi:predicted transposase YbfD/YdcC